MKVIDNFLEKESFNNIQTTIMSSWFPWYYNEYVNNKNEENVKTNFQFTHLFFKHNDKSNFFDLINPILNKLNILSLLRIKANLSPLNEKQIKHPLHMDCDSLHMTSGIFYVNTNNGYTQFEDGSKIESVANRFVEFDSKKLHAAVTQNDEKTRILINFCYLKR